MSKYNQQKAQESINNQFFLDFNNLKCASILTVEKGHVAKKHFTYRMFAHNPDWMFINEQQANTQHNQTTS